MSNSANTERDRFLMTILLAVSVCVAVAVSGLFSKTTLNLALPVTVRDGALSEKMIDSRPTIETIEKITENAANIASDKLRRTRVGFTTRQIADLEQAYREKLLATLSPDFERDFGNVKNRGYKLNHGTALSNYKEAKETLEWLSFASFSSNGMEVLVRRSPDGQYMPSPDGYLETYAEVKADTSRFDLPSGGMEVELMVPFLIRTIEKASRDKTEMVFVGFRFQWSNHRDQWIPDSRRPQRAYR